jgi:hypothetical protein
MILLSESRIQKPQLKLLIEQIIQFLLKEVELEEVNQNFNNNKSQFKITLWKVKLKEWKILILKKKLISMMIMDLKNLNQQRLFKNLANLILNKLVAT